MNVETTSPLRGASPVRPAVIDPQHTLPSSGPKAMWVPLAPMTRQPEAKSVPSPFVAADSIEIDARLAPLPKAQVTAVPVTELAPHGFPKGVSVHVTGSFVDGEGVSTELAGVHYDSMSGQVRFVQPEGTGQIELTFQARAGTQVHSAKALLPVTRDASAPLVTVAPEHRVPVHPGARTVSVPVIVGETPQDGQSLTKIARAVVTTASGETTVEAARVSPDGRTLSLSAPAERATADVELRVENRQGAVGMGRTKVTMTPLQDPTEPQEPTEPSEPTEPAPTAAPVIGSKLFYNVGSSRRTFPLTITDEDTAVGDLTVTVENVSKTAYGRTTDGVRNVASIEKGEAGFSLTFRPPYRTENADYAVSVKAIDPEGNSTQEIVQVRHFSSNKAPTVSLPGNKIWAAGSAERVLPVEMDDELLENATVTMAGLFEPANGSEPHPFPVRQDESGNILFDPSSEAENALGLYHIDVTVEDVHGKKATDSVEIVVANEVHAPTLTVRERQTITAPAEDSVQTVTARLRDQDTPMGDVQFQAVATVRSADERGRMHVREILLGTEIADDGNISIRVPVRGGVYSETAITLRAVDTSDHTTEAKMTLVSKPEASAPVVNLGASKRYIAVNEQAVELPIEVSDINGDTLRVSATAVKVGTDEAIPVDVIQREGVYYLRVTPNTAGEFDVTVTAKETVTGTKSTSASVRIVAEDDSDRVLRTPIWQGGENEYSSRGQTEVVVLEGIRPGATELRANNIYVRGKTQFEGGRENSDLHATKTLNHDSFDQAVAFHGLNRLRNLFENANLGVTWAEVVASKTGKTELKASINSITDVNAFYSPRTEDLNFGTSDGKWSLGSDSDVVLHEAGHWMLDHRAPNLSYWGDAGAMHEGYGDAQASLVLRDPDMSEDFGKILGEEGKALRNVQNDTKISDTRSQVHDRGRVFGGMMWSVGEQLHRQITGKRRSQEVDKEKLNEEAANFALKILWTYPVYLGTRSPSRVDFVRSLLSAVDDLDAAGHVPQRVDVNRLKNFILTEGVRRELLSASFGVAGHRGLFASDSAAPYALGQRSETSAVRQALKDSGFAPTDVQITRGSTQRTPRGFSITRYNVTQRLVLADGSRDVRIDDDYISIIARKDGTYEAQLGHLPDVLPSARASTDHVVTLLDGDTVGFTLESLADQLTARAESRLRARQGSVSAGREEHDHGHGHRHEHVVTRRSLQSLQQGEHDAVELRWVNGRLTAWLELDAEGFSAEVTRSGELVNFKRHSMLIEG